MDKLTIVKWRTGLPREEGRYLVQIYSGGIDIDYYDIERGWDSYLKGDILRWTKLSELEEELNMDPLEKYKSSKEVSKINLEELKNE